MNTQFRAYATLTAGGRSVEYVVQLILEGIKNTQRHGHADSAMINVRQIREQIRITIDDDRGGFGGAAKPPLTMASRVAEIGGELAIRSDVRGALLEIAIPAV